MFDDLKNRRVLITGASTGIGAAAAVAFARLGAQVAINYNRSEAGAQRVAGEITEAGGHVTLVQGDLRQHGQGRSVVERAIGHLGGLDTLINNAGSLVRRVPFTEITDGLIDEVFDLNVRAVIEACQAAIPELEKSKAASIINVGSIAGSNGGGPGSAMYASAKAWVHNLTRHLAQDLGRKGIRVNAIAPGVIATPFHAATPPERMEAMRASVHLGRVGVPDDCVGPLLFLASPSLSGYVTGQVLHVNGGQYMP